MYELTIYRQYFTNADCYKSGTKQTPKGIQVHSTGSNNPYLKRYVQPDDGRLGVNRYNNSHNKPGLTVCANAYIGKLDDGTPAVYQALPWDYRCWLSGSGNRGNANKLGYIGYEICEDGLNNEEYFNQVVKGLSVRLDAYLCKKFNIPLNMIHDHSELHGMGLASNHADIRHWLVKFGYSMNDYRDWVRVVLEEGIEVTYIEGSNSWVETEDGEVIMPDNPKDPIYLGKVQAKTGTYVNLRSQPVKKDENVIYKVPTGSIVDVLQEVSPTWDIVRFQGLEGYMMSEFIVKQGTDDNNNNNNDEETITIPRKELVALREQLWDAIAKIDNMLLE